MLLSDVTKFSVLAFLLFSSCSVRQASENVNTALYVIEETKAAFPFQNKEPETFQAEIVVKNYLGDEVREKSYFLARSGALRLTVFDRGERDEKSVLRTADGKTFFIDKEKRTFRENRTGQIGGELVEFLTVKWLNQKTNAAFENLGAENNLTKYRVHFTGSEASEIVIFVDENLKLPVRQEFYSIAGEQKTLTLSAEMKNFQLSADENLFKLPQDYKRIENK